MAASAGVDPLESAPEVAVLLLEHGDAGQELLDPRLEGGKGIAGLSQLGDYEADGEQESLTGAEEHGEDLLVVAWTPEEGIEGVPVELVVPAVNHALPHFLLRARMPLPRRTGKT
jgi:hypothetical protein